MHSVLEGVAKTLFSFWFEKSYGLYSLKNKFKFDAIQSILSIIRPPHFVANPPRLLSSWKLWKANDFLSFFLFYALIVFRDIMEPAHYTHLIKCVVSLEHLLAPTIHKESLKFVQELLEEFVEEFGELYSAEVYSSGTHELLHLVEATLRFGPMNSINSFQFEELNRKITGMVFGKDLIGEEFIKLFSVVQAISFFHSRIDFKNKALSDSFNENFVIRTSNRKKLNSNNGLIVTCSVKYIENAFFSELLSKNNIHLKILPSIPRCYFNGVYYTDCSNDSKFCDFCVYDNINKVYGLITMLIFNDDKVLAIIKRFMHLLNPFFNERYPDLKSEIFMCSETDNYIISSIDNLKKCFFVKSKDFSYISTFRSSHLFN
jgi:hypothetical protein